MENKLKKLFDYQRFEKNEKLEKLIQETEIRYAVELSDDDLSLVNAAGEPEIDTNSGGSNMPEKMQVGGLSGDNTKGGPVSGFNIGGITGDFIGNYSKNNDSKK
ncbi:MAG: hypothetical protein KBS74_00850 [Clostridiales bacterium]|nr:hypothetical protein [Candidatus Cacconaster stercorequi]